MQWFDCGQHLCMTANLPHRDQLLGYNWAIILGGLCCSQTAAMAASYLPAFIFLELVLPWALQKLLEADESILILVNFVHDMFPHAVHLLVSLHHVILGRLRIICLVQLTHPTTHTLTACSSITRTEYIRTICTNSSTSVQSILAKGRIATLSPLMAANALIIHMCWQVNNAQCIHAQVCYNLPARPLKSAPSRGDLDPHLIYGPLFDWVKFLCPTRHRMGHFRDVLSGQSLGLVLKN